MTPKEKATELVKKFDNLLPCEGTTTGQTPIDCALICVDELIHSFIQLSKEETGQTHIDFGQGYWEQVKS